MKMIPVPMGPELIREMMEAMKTGNYTNRSEFIRDAIVEKAVSLGLDVPPSLARPPQRVVYPVPKSRSVALNDNPSSTSAGKPGGSVAEVAILAEALAHQHSLAAPAPTLKTLKPSHGKKRRASGGQQGKGGRP